MASFPNIYTHRKVAETAAKSCEICFKPSTSVLLASGNKDFFYVCPVHLKDKKFCKPLTTTTTSQVLNAATQQQKISKKETEEEIARLKKEYEEKQKKKLNKSTEDESVASETKDQKSKEKEVEKVNDKKSADNKPELKPSSSSSLHSISDEPREFSLMNVFYQQRIEKKKNAEIAKQRRDRLQNPNLFPQVPKNLP